ncbi:MAG: sigma 54-interacting transcriptional regulator [Firmicutes bacterium]|nr:sigma 54-interacting transcriptional regulator [Bacillota bacterium]
MTLNNQPSHLETILDSIADGIFTVDLDWRITSFNRAAERITGMSREEAVGKMCFEVFHANICQANCALKETLATGREIIDQHVNIIDRAGNIVPISISTAVLRDENGMVVGGVETFRDLSTIEELRKQLLQKYTFEDIVSKNHEMIQIFNLLPLIAESDSNVLIQGPSGSGKELIARAIHNLSPRKSFPYVAVNCGALPDTLLESELFGYAKGAFTGADKDKPGRFTLAEGGTIFLDEVGEISPAFQVKLLRTIQEREYTPLGATKTVKMNVRVIAATNRDLLQLVRQNSFREDLYYRLNVVKIELPSLAERREDIPLLIDHFIRRFNLRRGRNITGISPAALRCLMEYHFPGNIRELENIIEYAFVVCQGHTIGPEHLPKEIWQKQPSAPSNSAILPLVINRSSEAEVIRQALMLNGGHKGKTAAALGIDRSTLWRKMKKYGL